MIMLALKVWIIINMAILAIALCQPLSDKEEQR